MKIKWFVMSIVVTLSLGFILLVGCAPQQQQDQGPSQTSPPETTPDVTTSASIVDNADDFKTAISDKGSWIIAVTKDITSEEELVLAGEFKNGKKDENGNDIIQRKVALYEQDENRNVTARYTLKAPKLTILSPKASIQHGTFVGDLYVSANDFQLVDTKVEGNIYFTTEEAQSTFTKDEASSVTGKTELKK